MRKDLERHYQVLLWDLPGLGLSGKSKSNDYSVPRMSDVPEIEVKVLSTPNSPSGIGEMGGNITGAIANAVAAASGARVRHMPLTPERVLAAMRG